MCYLKRVLPFALTLMFGISLGDWWTAYRLNRMVTPVPLTTGLPVTARPAAGDVFNAKEVTRKAIITARPEPLYTQEARRESVTGTVVLRLVLGADGRVTDVRVVKALPGGLTEQAVEAARGIEFIPAQRDGRAVSQYVTVEYNFNIY